MADETLVIGLWEKRFYVEDATGTFVNRNHFAGMLAMCLPLVLSALVGKRPLLFKRVAASVRFVVASLYAGIVAIAIILSHSRMGLAAMFFGICFWGFIFARDATRVSNNRVRQWIPPIFGLAVSLFLVWFGVEDVLKRYLTLENGDDRLAIWSATFNMPLSAWLVGIGPGEFEDVFHLVQPINLNVRYLYAHNDYLEFLLEFGLIGAGLIVAAFVYWWRAIYPRGNLALRAGAVGALVAVALHSTVDFNLQIPGSAIFAWIALGLLVNPNMVGDGGCEEEITSASTRLRNDGKGAGRDVRPKRRRRVSGKSRKRAWLDALRSD